MSDRTPKGFTAFLPDVADAWDTAHVERFEALVHAQQQQPASAPWTPVTDYSFEARKAIEGQHPQLIKDVFQPTSVLDAGCGPAHLVRLLLELDVDVWGCDRELCPTLPLMLRDRVFYQDIARSACDKYDLVICREVLEHLAIRQAVQAVRNLVNLSSRYVYVTTRFAKTPSHLLDVDTSDELDPTHITMLTKPFLRTLFVLEGCKSRPDLEAKMDWKNLGRCLVFEVA